METKKQEKKEPLRREMKCKGFFEGERTEITCERENSKTSED